MTLLNFPSTDGKPTDGSFTYTANGVVYSWDGEKWLANNESALNTKYVQVSGDTMTGQLDIGSISLDTDGTAEFGSVNTMAFYPGGTQGNGWLQLKGSTYTVASYPAIIVRDKDDTTLASITYGGNANFSGDVLVGDSPLNGDGTGAGVLMQTSNNTRFISSTTATGAAISVKTVGEDGAKAVINGAGEMTLCGGLSYPVEFTNVGTLAIGDTGSSGGAEAGSFYSRLGVTVYKNNEHQGTSTTATNNFVVGLSSATANAARDVKFCINNSGRYRSAASTSINQISSERRLKTNIELIDPDVSWQTVRDLPYYSYNWKSNPNCPEKTHGPMAGEVPAEMCMDTYVEDENGNDVIRMDAEGPIRTYDNDMLQGRLFVALQTALKRIEQLEAKVQQLEGGNN